MYYLTKFDDVLQSGVIPKFTSANLCKPIHDISYPTSIRLFESGNCGNEGKKLQKFEHLKKEKSFSNEIENIFIVYEGLLFGEKTKL